MVTANALETAIELDQFTSNVEIFTSTKAKDIPSKINALGVDLKGNLNTNLDNVLDYVNNTVVPHINSEMQNITDDYNTYTTNLTTQQTNFETNINNQQNTFESEMTGNISGYIDAQGVGYSISQANEAFGFTTSTDNYTYDSDGRVTQFVEGNKTTSNITYDSKDRITGFTETITVDEITTVKTFTVSKDVNDNTIITEVV